MPRWRAVAVPHLLAALVLYFGSAQLLLWAFIGLASWPLVAAGLALLLALTLAVARLPVAAEMVPLQRLGLLFAFALLVYALGGEGRFFYANIDWQVRDAVLRDMTVNPWPFVYQTDAGERDLLRAAIGFFLWPALAGKLGGLRAGDIALLVQNAALLALLLGAGSALFARTWQRAAALAVVTLFGGLDIVLQWMRHGQALDHMEFSFSWLQFSAHLTQAFWVPQHSFAGWVAALLFLLWHRGQVPIAALLITLPLTALWSPLPLIGAMPFVLWAGAVTVLRGELRWRDIALPALAVVLAVPSLLYLAAAPEAVGLRLVDQPAFALVLFQTAEVWVWLVPLLLWWRDPLRGPLWLAGAVLAALPLFQIGWSHDLMMRASIPALALIAAAAALALTGDGPRRLKILLAMVLLVGATNALHEVARALREPPAPRGACSFYGAWDVSFGDYPKGSHLARFDRVPALIRPDRPAIVPVRDPTPCWRGRWLRPSGV